MSILGLQSCWVIGYGNRQRRDDGIGPFVVEGLRRVLVPKKGVSLLAVPQLRADLIEKLKDAGRILFIDAAIDGLAGGWTWRRVLPDKQSLPYLTHHVQPAYLLGLMEMLYHRSVPAWLISVYGSDFEFGEGLSPAAEGAVDRLGPEILAFIRRKN